MTQTPTDYIHNLYKRMNTLFTIRNGIGFYIEEGKEIPVAEFYKMYPLGDKIRRETLASVKGSTVDPRYVN